MCFDLKTEFLILKKDTKRLRRIKSKPEKWTKENKEQRLKRNRLNALKKIIFELYINYHSISLIRKFLISNYGLDIERQFLTSWLKANFDIDVESKKYKKRKLTPKESPKENQSKIDPFRNEIILLYEEGCSIAELARYLSKKEIKVDRKTISRWLHKYFDIREV